MASSGLKGQPVSAASDILAGFQTFTATTAATTIITIPINRIWVGTIALNASVQNAGANATVGNAQGVVSISGGSATPAAGNYLQVNALCGANVAAGTVGDQGFAGTSIPMTISAGSVQALVQITVTITGATGGNVSVTAAGMLQ